MNKWVQRIVSISLAARVSIVVAITMWLLAAITWWVYASDPTRVGWGSYMTTERAAALFMTWLVCVAAVYAGIRVAMNDTPLGHAGARKAWRAGRSLLINRGLSFGEVPCFLTLGAVPSQTNRQKTTEPLAAQNEGQTETDSCVDWHLQDQGLIANLRGLGRYEPSRLRGSSDPGRNLSSSSVVGHAATQTQTQTLTPPSAVEDVPPSPDDASPDDASPDDVTTASPDVGQRATATVEQADRMIDEALQQDDHATATVLEEEKSNPHRRAASATSSRRTLRTHPLESSRSLRREQGMIELLQRLRRERQPFAPINGILAVVPAEVLLPSREAEPDRPLIVARQLRHDLRIIRNCLGVDTPITLCVESPATITPKSSSKQNASDAVLWGLHLDPAQCWETASLKGLADRFVSAVIDRVDEELLSEVTDGQDRPRVITHYRHCQRFAAECRALRSSLQTFLAEAFPLSDDADADPRLSGVFIEHPDRIFDPVGIIQVLQDQQHELQWTLNTELQQRRQFRLNLAMALVFLGLLAAVYWQWQF